MIFGYAMVPTNQQTVDQQLVLPTRFGFMKDNYIHISI